MDLLAILLCFTGLQVQEDQEWTCWPYRFVLQAFRPRKIKNGLAGHIALFYRPSGPGRSRMDLLAILLCFTGLQVQEDQEWTCWPYRFVLQAFRSRKIKNGLAGHIALFYRPSGPGRSRMDLLAVRRKGQSVGQNEIRERAAGFHGQNDKQQKHSCKEHCKTDRHGNHHHVT